MNWLRTAADAMTKMLTFPYRCRQALTTETPIPEPELSAFCEEIRVLANYNAPNAEEAHRRADAVTGGIAVLAILHGQWLKSNEELNRWCSDQVGQVLESPPQELPWSIPESATDTHWQGFVGEITIFEFAETLNNDSISHCSFNWQHPTFMQLLRSCFGVRFGYAVV